MSKRSQPLQRDYAEEAGVAVPLRLAAASAASVTVKDHTHGSTGDGGVLSAYALAGSVPAYAYAEGTAGQIAYASGYIYVCVATDTWQRAAIATWGAAPLFDFSVAGNSQYLGAW